MLQIYQDYFRPRQFVSMRVHGSSAHVEFDEPDLPEKKTLVFHAANGTFVTSNHASAISVHIAVPTPLVVERNVNLRASLLRAVGLGNPVGPVFAQTWINLKRVFVELSSTGVYLASLEVWDGNQLLLNTPDILTLIANDPLLEESYRGNAFAQVDVEARLLTGLGITIRGRFENWDFDSNRLTVHSARAIYESKG